MADHRFFFGYLWGTWRRTPLWSYWQRWLTVFRRFRTVALVIRVLTFLFSLLQTGTLVILSTLIFLVILPLLAVLMLGILITAAIESRRSNRYLERTLTDRRVCVLFPSADPTPFFAQSARRLVAEGFAVIVVSPFWISARGIGHPKQKRTFYATLRREAPDLYLVRRYYFFSLRKHVLQKVDTAYLY